MDYLILCPVGAVVRHVLLLHGWGMGGRRVTQLLLGGTVCLGLLLRGWGGCLGGGGGGTED